MLSILVPTLISLLALTFSVLTFWHVNQRKGRLFSTDPITYQCRNSDPEDIVIRVPLVLTNTGPVGIVIADIRANISGRDFQAHLVWELERSKMDTEGEDHGFKDWATPINISGHDSVKHVIEFGHTSLNPCYLTAWESYTITIEGYIGYAKSKPNWNWKQLCQFEIFGPPDDSRKYLTNYPTANRHMPDLDE